MVQTWMRDRWYDHNCGENYGIKFEPACNNLQHGPLKIQDSSISLQHANILVVKTTSLEEGKKLCIKRKEIIYSLSRVILATYTETYKQKKIRTARFTKILLALYIYDCYACIKNEERVD